MNGAERLPKVSPETGIGPWMALPRKQRTVTEMNGGISAGRDDLNVNSWFRKSTEINGGPRHKVGDKKGFHHLTPNFLRS